MGYFEDEETVCGVFEIEGVEVFSVAEGDGAG
jgi:hypothetical protein